MMRALEASAAPPTSLLIMDIIFFETTMRDGELTPGVKMELQDKIAIAKILEEMGVDIIEVGYPGRYQKDFEEIFHISQLINTATICGLASSKPEEIIAVAEAIKPAPRGRINTYTNVNLKHKSQEEQILTAIKDTVSLARHYCDDVQWNAFDATRSQPDFLCRAIEMAINCGAATVTIPDSLGVASPEEFAQLLQLIFHRVPNIDQAIIAVHCHDDLGWAADNSLVALDYGVRQIEVAIDGLGARKGNADLALVARKLRAWGKHKTKLDFSLFEQASELVKQEREKGNYSAARRERGTGNSR